MDTWMPHTHIHHVSTLPVCWSSERIRNKGIQTTTTTTITNNIITGAVMTSHNEQRALPTHFLIPTTMTRECFLLVEDDAPFRNSSPFAPPSTVSLVLLVIIELPTLSRWKQHRFETTQSWECPSSHPLPNHQG